MPRQPGSPPVEPPDAWVGVAAFPTRPFADFVASALEGNGIEARVVGDDGGGMLMHLDTLSGGVHVLVRAEQVEAASVLLGAMETDAPPDEVAPPDEEGPDPFPSAGSAGDGTPDDAPATASDQAAMTAPIAARSSSPWRTIVVVLAVVALLFVVAAAFLEL